MFSDTPKRFLKRLLSFATPFLSAKSISFGKYWLNSPLVFSLMPCWHDQYGHKNRTFSAAVPVLGELLTVNRKNNVR